MRRSEGIDAATGTGRDVGVEAGAGEDGVTQRPVLEVDDLDVAFATDRGTVRAVNGVSLTVRPGRRIGVVGESGSGKSVLARAAMGLLARGAVVLRGSVRLDGRDLLTLPPAELRGVWGRDVAMVFQDPTASLTPTVTIGRQLCEVMRAHTGCSRREARARAVELLAQVGIPDARRRLGQYPHELSGGMRQRVCIAIALSCEPKLLIADEPTTALDVTIQRQILDLLDEQRRRRAMSMILVTHDFGVVAGRTDEIVVMYAGRVVEHAPARTLFVQRRHPYSDALLRSLPRLEWHPQTLLPAIPGRPPDPTALGPGCSFAPRCPNAQPRCLAERPPLATVPGSAHSFACFFPVGTPEGDDALARNVAASRTATGTTLEPA